MSYELYGDYGSGATIIELAMAEMGIAYEFHLVDLGSEQQRQAEFLRLNPAGKVPAVITPEGELLTESLAILLTLVDRFGGRGLLPAEPVARASAMRWLCFMATELYPVIEIIDYPERFDASENPEGVRAVAVDKWRRRWMLVEQAAIADPWFLGEDFSVVDIYAAVVSRWAHQAQWRPVNLPKIEAIAVGLAARPALAGIWRRSFPGGG